MASSRRPSHPRTFRILVASLVCLLACLAAVLVGFATCDTESGTCPAWHEWIDTVAFYGVGVFLVASIVLSLMIGTDELLRRTPR